MNQSATLGSDSRGRVVRPLGSGAEVGNGFRRLLKSGKVRS